MFVDDDDSYVRPVLYYDHINPHSRAALMLLSMLNIDVELKTIEMITGEHLNPAYAKLNPARTVPTMIHKDYVVTGNAIFSYICENHTDCRAKQLIALNCDKQHCRVLNGLYFETQLLHRIHGQLMTDLIRKTIYNTDVDFYRRKIEVAYDVMESYLQDGPYMAGAVLTAVDISFVACLGALDLMFPIDADTKRWAKLNKWHKDMQTLPIHKINMKGIAKQRRIVEYYAKFQFSSYQKSFPSASCQSIIPYIALGTECCNAGSEAKVSDILQLVDAVNDFVDETKDSSDSFEMEICDENKFYSSEGDNEIDARAPKPVGQSLADIVAEPQDQTINSQANQCPPVQVSKDVSITVYTFSAMVTEPIQCQPKQVSSDIVAESGDKMEIFEGNELSAPAGEEVSLTDIVAEPEDLSFAAHTPPTMATEWVKFQSKQTPHTLMEVGHPETWQGVDMATALDDQKPRHLEVLVEESDVFNDNKIPNITACRKKFDTEDPAPITQNNICLPNKHTNLNRLGGGIEVSAISSKQPASRHKNTEEFRANAQMSLVKKGPETTTKKPEIVREAQKGDEKVVVKKTNKQALLDPKYMSNMKTLLPPGIPINSQQLALQYSPGLGIQRISLAAPPPTRENSSQDEQNDEEFPAPPSEVLLQAQRKYPAGFERLNSMNPHYPTRSSVTDSTPAGFVSKIASRKSNETSGGAGRALNGDKQSRTFKKTDNSFRGHDSRTLRLNSQTSLPKNKTRKILKANPLNTIKSLIVAATTATQSKGHIKKPRKTIKLNMNSSADAIKKRLAQPIIAKEVSASNSKTTEMASKVEVADVPPLKENVEPVSEIAQTTVTTFTAESVEPAAGISENTVQHSDPTSLQPAQSGSATSGQVRPAIPAKTWKDETDAPIEGVGSNMKSDLHPSRNASRNQAKFWKDAGQLALNKIFENSTMRGTDGNFKRKTRVVSEKKVMAKNKQKMAAKTSREKIANLPLPTPTEEERALSTPEVQNETTQQPRSPSPTMTPITEETNTTERSETPVNQMPATSLVTSLASIPPLTPTGCNNSQQRSSSAVTDVNIEVGFVAKALQTLGAAESHLSTQKNISGRVLLSQQASFAVPQPKPLLSTSVPPKDDIVLVGTVAKALQSLNAINSEANTVCSMGKSFGRNMLLGKNSTTPRTSVLDHTKSHGLTTPVMNSRIIAKSIPARPLAEVLRATVQETTERKLDAVNQTTGKRTVQKSFGEHIKKSDKVMGKMPQISETEPMNCQFIPPLPIYEILKSTDKKTDDGKESEITSAPTKADTILDDETIPPPQAECTRAPALSPSNAPVNSSISDALVSKDGTVVPCTEMCEGSASKSNHSLTKSTENRPNIKSRVLIDNGMFVMEPTPLPKQRNLVIRGIDSTELNTPNRLFVSRALANVIPPAVQRVSKLGVCTHGPSANVVISTFGYTPMSELDPISEQDRHIKPFLDLPPPPPPSALSIPDSGENVDPDTAVRQIQPDPLASPVEVSSMRVREDRPYPTAHRLRNQKGKRRAG